MQTAPNYYKDLLLLAEKKQLGKLLEGLKEWIEKDCPSQKDEYLSITQTYKYLLDYYIKKTEDKQREKVYLQCLEQTYCLLDKVNFEIQSKNSNLRYFENYRNCVNKKFKLAEHLLSILKIQEKELLNQLLGDEINNRDQVKTIESLQDELFFQTWASTQWTKEEFEVSKSFLLKYPNSTPQLVFASAITISTLCLFDYNKILCLLELGIQLKGELFNRIFVGLILIAIKNQRRILNYEELRLLYKQFVETPTVSESIKNFQYDLINSFNIKHYEIKLNKEILPNLLKFQNLSYDKIHEIMDDSNDLSDIEPPEKINAIRKNMQDIQKMHESGIDLPFFTFSHLKNFSFFYSPAHWLWPYSLDCSYIKQTQNETTDILKNLMDVQSLCNSDKYSLSFFLSILPSTQKEQILKGLNIKFEDVKEVLNKNDEKIDNEYSQRAYLQDLYRFFCLCPRVNMANIFSNPLIINNPLLKNKVYNGKQLYDCVLYCHKNKMYSEVIALYRFCQEENSESFFSSKFKIQQNYRSFVPKENEIEFKKIIAYDLEMLNELDEAIDIYNEILSTETEPKYNWIFLRISECYLKKNQISKAIPNLELAIGINPKDFKALNVYANCMLSIFNYEKAVSAYNQIAFHYPDNLDVLRKIALCQMYLKELDKAYDAYYKVLQQNPIADDYKNLGNYFFAKRNFEKAQEFYLKYTELGKKETFEFCTTDERLLITFYNLTQKDLRYMTDSILIQNI